MGLWVVLRAGTGARASLQHRGPGGKTGREQAVGAGSLSTQAGGVGMGSSRRLGARTSALADVTLSMPQCGSPRARPY